MASNWTIGAAMNVTGSVLINLGTNVMKLGHIRAIRKRERRSAANSAASEEAAAAPPDECGCLLGSLTWNPTTMGLKSCRFRKERFSKTWLLGFTAFAFGNALNFLSFSYAAQSLLASLGSVQFVTNVVFARVVLKEKLLWRTLFGTLVLCCGVGLVVTFSCHDNPAVGYSLKQLIALFIHPAYVTYLSVLAVLWMISQLVLYQLKKSPVPSNEPGDPYYRLEGLSFAAVSAIVGAQSVTLFKILSELIAILSSVSANDDVTAHAIYTSPFSYLVAIGAIFTSVFWVQRLNAALRLYDTLFIVPLFQVMWITLSVVGGGIFFHEFDDVCFRGKTVFMFIFGLSTIFFGVYLLSPGRAPSVAAVHPGSEGSLRRDSITLIPEDLSTSANAEDDEEQQHRHLASPVSVLLTSPHVQHHAVPAMSLDHQDHVGERRAAMDSDGEDDQSDADEETRFNLGVLPPTDSEYAEVTEHGTALGYGLVPVWDAMVVAREHRAGSVGN